MLPSLTSLSVEKSNVSSRLLSPNNESVGCLSYTPTPIEGSHADCSDTQIVVYVDQNVEPSVARVVCRVPIRSKGEKMFVWPLDREHIKKIDPKVFDCDCMSEQFDSLVPIHGPQIAYRSLGLSNPSDTISEIVVPEVTCIDRADGSFVLTVELDGVTDVTRVASHISKVMKDEAHKHCAANLDIVADDLYIKSLEGLDTLNTLLTNVIQCVEEGMDMMIGIPSPSPKYDKDGKEQNVFVFGFQGIDVNDKFEIEVPCPGLIHEKGPFPWIDNPNKINFSYWVGLVTNNQPSNDDQPFVVDFKYKSGNEYSIEHWLGDRFFYKKTRYGEGVARRKLMTTEDVSSTNDTKRMTSESDPIADQDLSRLKTDEEELIEKAFDQDLSRLKTDEEELIEKAFRAMSVQRDGVSSYQARTTNIFGMRIGESKVCKLKIGQVNATPETYIETFEAEQWAAVASRKEYIDWPKDMINKCKRLPNQERERFQVTCYEMNEQEKDHFATFFNNFLYFGQPNTNQPNMLQLELTNDMQKTPRCMVAKSIVQKEKNFLLWFDSQGVPAVISELSQWNSNTDVEHLPKHVAYAIDLRKDDILFYPES